MEQLSIEYYLASALTEQASKSLSFIIIAITSGVYASSCLEPNMVRHSTGVQGNSLPLRIQQLLWQ
jgi:hypothetical protein